MSPVSCEGLQLLGTEDSNFYACETVTLMLGWGWLKICTISLYQNQLQGLVLVQITHFFTLRFWCATLKWR